MRTRSIIPAAVLLGGCVLRHGPVQPEPARGPAADSLFRLDQSRGELLAAKGPLDGMMSLLDSDVVYLRSGVPAVWSSEGARELLSAPGPTVPDGISWEPLGGGVSYDLLAGYTFGIAASPSPHGAPVRVARYIAVWRRHRDSPWRIVAYAEIDSPAAVEASITPRSFTPPLVTLPAPQREAAAKVRAADSLFSDLADRMGVGYAFSNTIAREGVLFGSPQLVIGPDATREYYAARGGGTSLTWRPVYAWAAGSRDFGFTIGQYVATGRGPSGAAVQHFGKYLTVWRLQRDGTWKFVVDGGNSTPAKSTEK